MKKLNNKGITTIELIICFVLVVTITTALYSTVAAFNEKRIIEQYKEEVYTYKNLLTKEIQDDFIKIGITSASYNKTVTNARTVHTVNCVMKDGTKRKLIVTQQFAKSEYHPGGSTGVDDYYMIEYGDPDDLIEYPIPKLGYTKENGKIVQDFSINNVWISISDSNVLNIYIGFYHPELVTRYGIQIICPINFIATKEAVEGSLIMPKYTITYDSQTTGGIDASVDQSFFPGSRVKILDFVPQKENFFFQGWSKTPNVETPDYLPNKDYSFDGTTRVYAVWGKDLTLYDNGEAYITNTGGWSLRIVEPNGEGKIEDKYMYVGRKASDTNTAEYYTNNYLPAGKYKIHVEYDKKSSSGNFFGYSYFRFGTDQRIMISDNSLGIHREDFYVDSDGESQFVFGNFDSQDHIYVLKITKVDEIPSDYGWIKINYDLNDGVVSYSSTYPIDSFENQIARKGSTIILSQRTPVKTGYTFSGWSTSPIATSATYRSGATANFTADTTLYAVWTKS